MIGIQNYTNVDATDPTDYPDGCIKDDITGVAGTPIDKNTQNDIQLYFDKLLRMFSVTANNTFDGEVNGYQSILALQRQIVTFIAPLIESMIPAYSNTTTYVLTGLATRADNGVVFLNGGIYYVQGYGGAIPGGEVAVLTVNTFPTNSLYSLPGMPIAPAASVTPSTTQSNYNDLNFHPFVNTALALTHYAAFDDGLVPSRILLELNGAKVSLDGSYKNTAGGGVSGQFATLPVGARPSKTLNFVCYGQDSSGNFIPIDITVASTGIMSTSTTIATGKSFDLSNISFSTI